MILPALALPPARAQGALNTTIYAADGQRPSLQAVQILIKRLGAGDIQSRASQDIAESITHVIAQGENNLAVLPSSVLAFMERQGLSLASSMRFIARVGVLDVHVLASQRITTLSQLTGQRVAVGPRGSQQQVTVAMLLERASVRIDPIYVPDESALPALIHGQLAAMIFLAVKPAKLLFNVSLADGVHFIPIAETSQPGRRSLGSMPTQILPEDYSLLSGAEAGGGQPVSTIAIPLMLVCFDWIPISDQYLAMTRVGDLLAQRGSGLPGFDMRATVPGWQRFEPVATWLTQGGSMTAIATATQRAAFAMAHPVATDRPPQPAADKPSPGQDPQMYQEYQEWQKHR